MAEGMSSSQVFQSITGQVSDGAPAGTAPSTETPCSSRWESTTTTVATTSTTSAHGTAPANRLPSRRTATAMTAMSRDHRLVMPMPVMSAVTLSTNSPPESIFTPSILAIWLTRMSSASPPTKPTRMGLERKLARKPSLKKASSRNIPPHRMAWARASVA